MKTRSVLLIGKNLNFFKIHAFLPGHYPFKGRLIADLKKSKILNFLRSAISLPLKG